MGLLDKLSNKKAGSDEVPQVSEEAVVKTDAPTEDATKSEQHPPTTVEKSASVSDTSESDTQGEKPAVTEPTVAEVGEVRRASITALAAEEQTTVEVLHPDGEDEAVYPTGLKLFLISIALFLSVFLVALDNTIIATAIPKITDQFNSLDDVGWYGSAYLLTTCALQLFFGKLYTFFSIKLVFLTSILIFEVGSAVCGAAPNSTALIIGRAIAGIGSAGIFSGALVIIAYSVPLVKRPMFTGIIGGCYGIASIAGPLMGGAFTDGPGWPWCFYINLPFGAVTVAVIVFFFKSPNRKLEKKETFRERAKQLDLIGLSIFIVAIVTLLLALQWGGSTYAWSNWRIILCLTLFAVLFWVFLASQWYAGENATVPFKIIKQRNVAAACLWSVCLGGSFFILIYWIPIWFQAIKNASALKSGIMCLPMVLALVISSIASGVGVTTLGYTNPFYYASVVFAAVGAGLLTTFATDTNSAKWIGYQIIYGFGIGFGMQQSLITVQTVLPLKDIPVGTALMAFMQMFGGALFVSAAQNVFNSKLISSLVTEAPGVNPLLVITTGATSLKDHVPAQFLAGVRHAYNGALVQTWYISLALSCLSAIPAVLLQWKSVKGNAPGTTAAH